jgi:hypothetical protein
MVRVTTTCGRLLQRLVGRRSSQVSWRSAAAYSGVLLKWCITGQSARYQRARFVRKRSMASATSSGVAERSQGVSDSST